MKSLPGMPLNKVSVFELNVGDKVYDRESGKMGIVSDIRETNPECIEAFILLDGHSNEIAAYRLPNCVLM